MLINATEHALKKTEHVREKQLKMIRLLVVVLVGAVVAFVPSRTEAEEHIMLADLLELVSSKQYLERHVNVTMAKYEHAPAHSGTLGQPLLTFYAYGDRFVKFVVTPEARPEKEPVIAFAILMGKSACKAPPLNVCSSSE